MVKLNDRERAKKDIEKLKEIIAGFRGYALDEQFPSVLDWAERYLADAQYYFDKEDYFSAFGCANYAYGIIDGILIAEGKRA